MPQCRSNICTKAELDKNKDHSLEQTFANALKTIPCMIGLTQCSQPVDVEIRSDNELPRKEENGTIVWLRVTQGIY